MATGTGKKKLAMTSEELSSFCDQVALMLDSGMTLRDGIEMLAEDEAKEDVKNHPYRDLIEVVSSTGSLYEAMKANEDKWPDYMMEMVGIGEETGRLEDIMINLSNYYQREGRIRSAAMSAITYPLVLGVMLVVIIGILLWRVLPVFNRVLESLGVVEGAGGGSTLMRIGTIAGWVVLGLIGAVVVAAVVILILMKTRKRDKVLQFLKGLIPPVRKVSAKLSSARVAGILGLMLSSGFPMENALQMAPAALSDQESIAKVNIIRDHMQEGETFSEALSKSGLFADFHNRMLKVGAVSGHEPQVMSKIAEIYEEQVEDDLGRLISIIEPTLVALLCVVIGAILLSVMLPMAGVLGSL